MPSAEDEILDFIASLNACWTRGDPGDLREYFHKDMVAVTPMDRDPRVGREACMEGWEGFAHGTDILSWIERGHRVRIFGDRGDCAVVTYFYELRCRMGGAERTLSGRDMYFLAREDGRWWAVADQFSAFP